MKPGLTCSRSWSLYFLISPGSFLLRLFSWLFNRLLLKMKFGGISCLFSFHGSLTLYLAVALLIGWFFEILWWYHHFCRFLLVSCWFPRTWLIGCRVLILVLAWFRSFDGVYLRALVCKNQTNSKFRGKAEKFDFFLILTLDRLDYN